MKKAQRTVTPTLKEALNGACKTTVFTRKANLAKKDLAVRWDCSVRTVEREVKKYGLIPADFIGQQPVWDEASVARMEERRKAAKMAKAGYPVDKIISTKEAKRIAGRRAA